jgi:hypothetical protein
VDVLFDPLTVRVRISPRKGGHDAFERFVPATALENFARRCIQHETPFRPE